MTKPPGTINLWELPGMLEKAGHDPGTSRDVVRNALLNRDLYAHTYILGGKYDPTGNTIDFDNTDWGGTAVWVALFTGKIPWPLNGDATDNVSVLVYEGDAQTWINSLTGRKANNKGKTDTHSWLVNLMKAGKPTKNKKAYLKDAKKQFSVSVRSFDKVWKAAIAETGNIKWSKPGRKS